MKNKKSKCIAIIFLLLPLISLPPVLAQAADSSPKWDQPFDRPMWLLHTNGGKYYDSDDWEDSGTITEERWILYPSNNGFIDKPSPDGGLIVRYSIDQRMGPYDTPRKVCAVAAGKHPCIVQGSDFIQLNCQDMPAQPEKPNQPDPGVGFIGELLVQTAAGTTAAKPGSKLTLSPGDRDKLGINCTKFVLLVRDSMGDDQNFTQAIAGLAYIRARGSIGEEGLTPGSIVLSDVLDHALLDLMNCVYTCARLYDENQGRLLKSASDSSPLLGSSMDQSDSPAQIELGLESGPFLAEVVNDKVTLILKTGTATVTSSGKNTFGVAYVPSIGTTYVAAYLGSVSIQPTNSNLAPFVLGAGQIVDISSEEIGPITPLSQVSGGAQGSTHVSPDGRDIYGPAGGAGNAVGQTGATSEVPQGGCYTDPWTGEVICVDAFGEITNPSSSTGTAYTTQPDAGSSVPQSLRECETYTSEICGTWTRSGDQFNAQWDNGASATLNVDSWDNGVVVLTRHDTGGSSSGLSARYEGRCTGNHVEGKVTWTWNGSTWSGTWSADW